LELGVEDQTHKVEGTVETSYVFQYTCHCVDAPLIDVVFCVKFENLIEIYAFSWSPIVI
jgi:hypothetical protein